MPLQLVHDIEDGYGDPLSVKATPDMSLRFLDETYAEANATIKEIQQHLEAFYRERDTPLARSGLKALATTMAGIYFIPFKTGASLQFSFSGQSIPNRVDVSEAKCAAAARTRADAVPVNKLAYAGYVHASMSM